MAVQGTSQAGQPLTLLFLLNRMKRFAKNPAQLGELDIVEGHHKNIASALIEEYAKHRKANPHVYAVHDYMHDDGPALIPRK